MDNITYGIEETKTDLVGRIQIDVPKPLMQRAEASPRIGPLLQVQTGGMYPVLLRTPTVDAIRLFVQPDHIKYKKEPPKIYAGLFALLGKVLRDPAVDFTFEGRQAHFDIEHPLRTNIPESVERSRLVARTILRKTDAANSRSEVALVPGTGLVSIIGNGHLQTLEGAYDAQRLTYDGELHTHAQRLAALGGAIALAHPATS